MNIFNFNLISIRKDEEVFLITQNNHRLNHPRPHCYRSLRLLRQAPPQNPPHHRPQTQRTHLRSEIRHHHQRSSGNHGSEKGKRLRPERAHFQNLQGAVHSRKLVSQKVDPQIKRRKENLFQRPNRVCSNCGSF